jgi:KDO2-lipid IV(A) lauroyltransferase
MGNKWQRYKRRARRKRLQHKVLLAVARVVLGLLSRLPPVSAARLGDALGRIGFLLGGPARRLVLDHLARALPGVDRRRIALRVFQNLSANALEWNSWCRRGAVAAAPSVVSLEGYEHYEAARAAGRGIIAVTGHFGLFELMPVWFVLEGSDVKVVGRRPSDTAFEDFVVGMRRSMGVETIPQTNGREILRMVKRGGTVGILPDQDIDKLPGIFVPFFGRDAWTPTGPATMAVTTGAAVIPLFIYRDGPARHRLVIHPRIEDPGGTKEERIWAITTAYTNVFESAIAADPEQWVWIHERWVTTPARLARRRARRAAEDARKSRRAKRLAERARAGQ